jgi:hypothetical protein
MYQSPDLQSPNPPWMSPQNIIHGLSCHAKIIHGLYIHCPDDTIHGLYIHCPNDTIHGLYIRCHTNTIRDLYVSCTTQIVIKYDIADSYHILRSSTLIAIT